VTATREAIVLPLLFLSVALCAGIRIGSSVVLAPPSLFALVLGILLLRLLIVSGTLGPDRLLSSERTALANINGVIVLLAVWAAAAQMFSMLIPDAGLPRLVFSVFFLILLLNTAAANPDRRRMLQSLAVTLGSVFVLKFVVLAALSDPGTGWLKRVLLAMLEGVTLGTLTQEVLHPASGYIALFALALFLVGLFLLPFRAEPPSTAIERVGPPEGGPHDSQDLRRRDGPDLVRGVRL
jgi:hypothetical protein